MTAVKETNALTTVLLANGKNGGRFLAVPVSCPKCESSNIDMLGHTRPAMGGRSIGGVLRCLDCHAEEVLAIHLEPFNQQRAALKEAISKAQRPVSQRRDGPVHGEERGYKWHMNHDRDPCDACAEAHRTYNSEMKRQARAKRAARDAAGAMVSPADMPEGGEFGEYGRWDPDTVRAFPGSDRASA